MTLSPTPEGPTRDARRGLSRRSLIGGAADAAAAASLAPTGTPRLRRTIPARRLPGTSCRPGAIQASAEARSSGKPQIPPRSSVVNQSREVETYVQRNRNPSLPGRRARRSDRRPSAAHRREALALPGAGRRPVARRAAGDVAGARPLLGDRLRLGRVRGETERAAAVQDRDRRAGHPLHPREVRARGRVAADYDARLARLGHRAARLRWCAHRPDRARRTRRGRVRPRAAVPARLRLLRRADRDRLGPQPHRAPGRS